MTGEPVKTQAERAREFHEKRLAVYMERAFTGSIRHGSTLGFELCQVCGSAVMSGAQELHAEWHAAQERSGMFGF